MSVTEVMSFRWSPDTSELTVTYADGHEAVWHCDLSLSDRSQLDHFHLTNGDQEVVLFRPAGEGFASVAVGYDIPLICNYWKGALDFIRSAVFEYEESHGGDRPEDLRAAFFLLLIAQREFRLIRAKRYPLTAA